ncbi:MAG: DUF4398 domain-containing protein [Brevinemataceae bacterium]
MKKFKIILLLFILSGSVYGCAKKPDLKNTVLAAEAMQRARDVQAPIRAPKEYKDAEKLFDQMNRFLDEKKYDDANNSAILTIEAANLAIRLSRNTIVEATKK